MKRLVMGAVVAVAGALLAAPRAQAQLFTPTFAGPRVQTGFGVYLEDWDPGDFALEGLLRRDYGGYTAGFRLGIIDAGDLAASLGAEVHNPIEVGADPVEMAFTAGIQGILGDVSAVGLQGGLSVGASFVPGNFTVTPYLHPRLALINGFGPDDDYDAEILGDLGIDFAFASGLRLQIGIALDGVGSDWGVGLAWR